MCGPIEHPDICESMPAVSSSFWPLWSQELLSGPNGEGKRSRCRYRELDLNPQEQKDFFSWSKNSSPGARKAVMNCQHQAVLSFFLISLPRPGAAICKPRLMEPGALAVALPTRADYGTRPSLSWSLENSRSSLTDPTSPMYILSLNFTDPHRRFRVH